MHTSASAAGSQAVASTAARALCLVLVSVPFVAAYALCNHLTGLRADVGQGVFAFERAIPFVPWTIVPYLSIMGLYAASFFVGDRAALRQHVVRVLVNLALSLVCYALFPLRFTFDRPLPDGLCGVLFELLGACDLPYNRAPSLHISVLLILWLRLLPCVAARWRGVMCAWCVLIAVSVLTTFQHHLIDIPAGLAVGALSAWLTSPPVAARLLALRSRPLVSATASMVAIGTGLWLLASPTQAGLAVARQHLPGGAGVAERYRSLQAVASDSLRAPRAGVTDLCAVPRASAVL